MYCFESLEIVKLSLIIKIKYLDKNFGTGNISVRSTLFWGKGRIWIWIQNTYFGLPDPDLLVFWNDPYPKCQKSEISILVY
jgi:hypothetical protein